MPTGQTTQQPALTGTPLVSVVMPTRNRSAALLGRALDSIKQQELQDFEVIVVDDGSSAETLAQQAKLRAGLDARFTLDGPIFPGARGTGPSAACNRGIHRARGEFLAFCDDDDHWIARDHLGVGVDMLRRHQADLFLGSMRVESGDKITPPRGWDFITSRLTTGPCLSDRAKVYEISLPALMGVMRHCNPSQRSAVIVRRELVDRVGLFWERVSYGEDTDWTIRLADGARKVLFRAEPVAGYNVSPHDSLTSRTVQLERLMQHLMEGEHLYANCSHRSVRTYARSWQAWHLRMLARLVTEEGRPAAAISLAWQAFCIYPTAGAAVNWAKSLLRTAASRASNPNSLPNSNR